MASATKPRFWAVEIIQTSAMDCGPACLTSLLQGFGLEVDYGRLREACGTGLDGTSIDALEQVAGQLGLETEQTILDAADLFRDEAATFPAILVTKQPSGALHFLVAWRRVGPYVQIMDPGRGRVWLRLEGVQRLLHRHTQRLGVDDWRAFAEEGPFLRVLKRRIAELGLGADGEAALASSLEDRAWQPLAALDATARFVEVLVTSKALSVGAEARAVFPSIYERALADATSASRTAVPDIFWSVNGQGSGVVDWSGAVALRALRRSADIEINSLPPLVRASLETKAASPLKFVWELLSPGSAAPLAIVAIALVLSVFGIAAQAFAVRTLVTIDQSPLLPRQRLIGLGIYAALLVVLACADTFSGRALRRMGRHFESRLWVAFLRKMPRLPERYFQSRLVSDMAERIQSAQQLRAFPVFGFRTARAFMQLALAVTAIGVVDVRSLPIALSAFAASWALPLMLQPSITERDMRLRSHGAALSRFVLDSLLGLIPARTHGAERAMRREHESLLAEWVRAGRSSLWLSLNLQALQATTNAAFLIWLVVNFAGRHGLVSPGVLVILYWGAQLPMLAQEILSLSREYPSLRNLAARIVEPLGATEVATTADADLLNMSLVPTSRTKQTGVHIELRDVTVMAGGHVILDDVSLSIAPGSHVAIVGRSGAGKSTLLSLLLGWQRPESGVVFVEDAPLTSEETAKLRDVTAWVDPGVQLWNQTLLDNVRYGAIREPSAARIGALITQADLLGVVERLPEGLQTPLGENGRLLSGGEGQRVRLARGLIRNSARLVLLDEPFRGLERPRRRELLWRARAIWSKATLLCVSHDVGDTESFDRVLVVDGGKIVEDGAPDALRNRPGSLYGQLLAQEELVKSVLFGSGRWRRLTLEEGRVTETTEATAAA